MLWPGPCLDLDALALWRGIRCGSATLYYQVHADRARAVCAWPLTRLRARRSPPGSGPHIVYRSREVAAKHELIGFQLAHRQRPGQCCYRSPLDSLAPWLTPRGSPGRCVNAVSRSEVMTSGDLGAGHHPAGQNTAVHRHHPDGTVTKIMSI